MAPMLLGAAIGATVMCLLDSGRGGRRRALLRDKTRHYANVAGAEAGKVTRHLGNKLAGARHRASAMLHRDQAPDLVIEDRVRSALGHATRQSSAIAVDVHDGVAVLSGEAAPDEMNRIVRRTRHVPGVREVENRLRPNGSLGVG
jgi:osmotically-inducible protein OsmY